LCASTRAKKAIRRTRSFILNVRVRVGWNFVYWIKRMMSVMGFSDKKKGITIKFLLGKMIIPTCKLRISMLYV
jgi:hypothetical protein